MVFIDVAIDQWHKWMSTCVNTHGGHFEHLLQLSCQVLPTAPNMCLYTPLAKKKCEISTCLTTTTGYRQACA